MSLPSDHIWMHRFGSDNSDRSLVRRCPGDGCDDRREAIAAHDYEHAEVATLAPPARKASRFEEQGTMAASDIS